jgi:MFS family permease
MVAEVNQNLGGRQKLRRRAGEMFAALGERNFRLFFTGAFLSNTGSWMQMVAQGWLVLALTNSPFLLGLDGFLAMAPGLVLTPLGGVLADLFDRRRLLIYSQVVSGLSALMLGVLVATGTVRVWMVLVLTFISGCCMALSSPAYQALTFDLAGRENLANAIALNSSQFQLSRVVGPVLAGVTIKFFGLAGCFFANGLSFVAVISALAMVRFDEKMKEPDEVQSATPKIVSTFGSKPDEFDNPLDESHTQLPTPTTSTTSDRSVRKIWADLIDGFRYALDHPRMRTMLIVSSIVSFFGAPYLALMPLFARDVFHLAETGLAVLMGTAGAGAFGGALTLAYIGDYRRKAQASLGGAFAFSICLIGFALSQNVFLALSLLFGVGFALTICVAAMNTYLQQLVTDEMRGRMMSLFMLSFLGTAPFGNLLAGWAAKHFGAPRTIAAGGLISAVYVIIVSFRRRNLWASGGRAVS